MEKDSDGGGERKAGYINALTTVRSIILVSVGVMEIGRKSACCLGAATFGVGLLMFACFHCTGIVDVAIERLNSRLLFIGKILALPLGETKLEVYPCQWPSDRDYQVLEYFPF